MSKILPNYSNTELKIKIYKSYKKSNAMTLQYFLSSEAVSQTSAYKIYLPSKSLTSSCENLDNHQSKQDQMLLSKHYLLIQHFIALKTLR